MVNGIQCAHIIKKKSQYDVILTLRWDTSTPGMDGIGGGVSGTHPGIQGTASCVNLISAPVIHLHNRS